MKLSGASAPSVLCLSAGAVHAVWFPFCHGLTGLRHEASDLWLTARYDVTCWQPVLPAGSRGHSLLPGMNPVYLCLTHSWIVAYASCTGSSKTIFHPQVCMYHTLEDWAGLSHIEDYLSYLEYLLWVFTPLAIVFILPFLIVILLYLSILFLHVYKVHRHILSFVLQLNTSF